MRAAHVFANGRGWGAASSSMPRARLLREISWPLLVTPAAVTPHVTPAAVTPHVTPAAVTPHVTREPTREPPQWPQPSASFHLPSRACRTSYAEGRWIRRELVCPSGDDGDSSRISETLDEGVDGTTTASASVHPLCAVPPSESGWQWCRLSATWPLQARHARHSHAPANRTVLFVGDSTMRFLWGAVANLLEPNATRRFVQFGYGCMVSPSIVGTGLPWRLRSLRRHDGAHRGDHADLHATHHAPCVRGQGMRALGDAGERPRSNAEETDAPVGCGVGAALATWDAMRATGQAARRSGRRWAAGAGGGRRLSSSRSRHEQAPPRASRRTTRGPGQDVVDSHAPVGVSDDDQCPAACFIYAARGQKRGRRRPPRLPLPMRPPPPPPPLPTRPPPPRPLRRRTTTRPSPADQSIP